VYILSKRRYRKLSKHRLTKKELKEDAFVNFFINSWEYIKTHQNHFFIGLIAIIVIIAGFMWYSNSQQASKLESSMRFAEAISFYNSGDMASSQEIFNILKSRYGSTMEGVFARYFLGKCAMAQGNNMDAITHFNDYLARSGGYPFYEESAREAIAVCLINERDFERAAETYIGLADETYEDMREKYIRKAAETYELGNRKQKALELYRELLDLTEGLAKREIEIKIGILSG
jgi:predicted negative regulator of RcsB-dependent stress response